MFFYCKKHRLQFYAFINNLVLLVLLVLVLQIVFAGATIPLYHSNRHEYKGEHKVMFFKILFSNLDIEIVVVRMCPNVQIIDSIASRKTEV